MATVPEATKKSSYSNTGAALEKIVAVIERQANEAPEITVERRKRLKDKITGKMREHDVVVTHSTAHGRTIIVALECRDRTRPVAVEAVEAFYTKCTHTGVHQGIIVSASGYAKTALAKAKALGLLCYEVKEAEQFDWCLAPGIMQYVKESVYCDFRLDFDDPLPEQPWTVIENGRELSIEDLNRLATNAINAIPVESVLAANQPPGTVYAFTIQDAQHSLVVRDPGGVVRPIKRLDLHLYFKMHENFVPLRFHRYLDAESGGEMNMAATADVQMGEHTVTFAIAGPEDGPKRISISPSPPKK